MSEIIASHGQSGGVTAHTINIGGAPATPPEPPKSGIKKIAAWIVGCTAFLASLVAIIEFLGGTSPTEKHSEAKKKATKPMSQQPQNINVTSFNQQGGITAHTVNLGAQPRSITPQFEQELLRVTNGYKKITVTCVLGDGEAFQFASAITNYLKAKGREVDGVNQAVYSGPVVGQQMNPQGDTLHLIIGTRQ